MTSSSVYTARPRARSPTPSASIAAKPLGPSWRPAPISPISADCSNTSTANPLWLNAERGGHAADAAADDEHRRRAAGRAFIAVPASALLVHAELALQWRFVGADEIQPARGSSGSLAAPCASPGAQNVSACSNAIAASFTCASPAALDHVEHARGRVAGQSDLLAGAQQQRREGERVETIAARFRIHVSELHRRAGLCSSRRAPAARRACAAIRSAAADRRRWPAGRAQRAPGRPRRTRNRRVRRSARFLRPHTRRRGRPSSGRSSTSSQITGTAPV